MENRTEQNCISNTLAVAFLFYSYVDPVALSGSIRMSARYFETGTCLARRVAVDLQLST